VGLKALDSSGAKRGKGETPKVEIFFLSLSLLTGLQDRLKLQKLSQNKSSFL
jgi:hypothetical protein